jgi:hypothetical protein
MIFLKNHPEVDLFIRDLNKAYKEKFNTVHMTNKALSWLAFCLTGIIITGCINWQKFQTYSAGRWKARALSWMLHYAKIPWEKLFQACVGLLIKKFDIKSCHLTFDDFDRHRSKRTKKIYGTYITRNKKGGGYVNAQNIVLLNIVTKWITMPVGWAFYRPDPKQKRWRHNNLILKMAGVPVHKRPEKPLFDKRYPSKKEAAAKLLRQFKYNHGFIKIMSISADGAYLSKTMVAETQRIYPKVQFISRLPCSQNIYTPYGVAVSAKEYFKNKLKIITTLTLRNNVNVVVEYCSARLVVKSHGKKRHIIAFRYENEEKFRYIYATELSWRAEDIILAFSLRWLCEVVIEDFKLYDGWGKESMQHGYDGTSSTLCLSLLLDLFLLQHPIQKNLHQTGRPLATAGSLIKKLQFETLVDSIKVIVESDDPKAMLQKVVERVEEFLVLRESNKHIYRDNIEHLKPSPSLQRKFANSA